MLLFLLAGKVQVVFVATSGFRRLFNVSTKNKSVNNTTV